MAYNEGMINGKYAFILVMKDVDEVSRKQENPFKWYISHYAETLHTTKEVRKALDAALILAPKLPTPSYSSFVDRLRKTIAGPPFHSNAYIGRINGTNLNKAQSQVCYRFYNITKVKLTSFALLSIQITAHLIV